MLVHVSKNGIGLISPSDVKASLLKSEVKKAAACKERQD